MGIEYQRLLVETSVLTRLAGNIFEPLYCKVISDKL